mgnify:FL=1
MTQLKIEKSWKEVIGDEFNKDYMLSLKSFLVEQIERKKIIYPHGNEIFSAFNYTPFTQTKVIII